ncbi:tolB protein precursor protein [Aggregicoccus sp. 17bor-14]|uniref:PD40 domain-containing protein n=1 Tax=Myxococcaceae TaxID=31 RepID=UPI00129D078C|nr:MULTISPECIES: PD40 domain-containing protein [Myxococcaceae]MBF5044862.1 PD40 domain-containing protein [Simulacricoccus sp. 17bor-14]MRI90606.1 tolB protein precursor protein [Aggregicoccus sp. 17bor-14]
MNRRPFALLLLAVLAVLPLLLPATARAQGIYVQPRAADRSAVRNFRFDWKHVDVLVGPRSEGEAAPLDRLGHVPSGSGATPGQAVAGTTAPSGPSPVTPGGNAATPIGVGKGEAGGELLDGGTPREDAGVVTLGEGVDAGAEAIALGMSPDGGRPDGGAGPVASLSQLDGGSASTADGGYARDLGAATGGVRLYFYEREREVAQRAAPIIEDAYRYLVDQFHYVPTKTFPYILYSTYQEFLQTNLSPVSEGTLGFTSPEDLKLTLPYLGDHRLFEEVGTHELAHEFTIQKVRTMAERAKVSGEPLGGMPLWFIEGLAEFYAKRGLDDEAEMLVRDLITNPDVRKGYAFLDFFSPGPYGYLWIYKFGQARCAFLEDVYGAGILQQILEESPRLVGNGRSAPGMKFEDLLQRLTGDEPKKISARFETWIKRRAFRSYLGAEQDAPALEPLKETDGYVTALNAAPSGDVLLYRSIQPNTGESRLVLADPRAPARTRLVTGDGRPSVESLHPVFGRNFDLTDDTLAYVAEVNARDVIYVQRYAHRAEEQQRAPLAPGYGAMPPPGPYGRPSQPAVAPAGPPQPMKPYIAVQFDLGKRRTFRLAPHGLVAAGSLSFSPDGRRVAFIGTDDAGTRDIFVLRVDGNEDAKPVRITNDVYAERQLSWGKEGIVYSSDATSHRFYNLFRVNPDRPSEVTRLTTDARDQQDPEVLPDGRIMFVSYENGRSDLFELQKGGAIVRRTDVTTGVFEVSPGTEGSVWVLMHLSGERVPSQLRKDRFLDQPVPAAGAGQPAPPLAVSTLKGAVDYNPWARENFEMGPIYGFAGGGSGGFVGQLFASATDRLRNQGLLLSVAVYGSFDFTDGYLLYLNQAGRNPWGGGPFQSVRFRFDKTFQNQNILFRSVERFFGLLGTIQHPLSTFTYVGADLAVGGANYKLDPSDEFFLRYGSGNCADPTVVCAGDDLLGAWRVANRGTRAQTELTLRAGYNTVRYDYATISPIDGSSALAEVVGGVQPFEGETYTSIRLDGQHYLHIAGPTALQLRGGVGTSFGGRFAQPYFLSSFDTLRGVNFGDDRWLLGQKFLFSTMELQIPLGGLVQVAFLNNIKGVAGLDFGAVGDGTHELWDRRVLDYAIGFNVGLGPLLMRLHFARPLDINSPFGKPDTGWVTNFSIGILGLNGFFGDQSANAHAPAPPGAQGAPAGSPMSGYTGSAGAWR